MDKHFEKLRDKSHQIVNCIAGSSIDRREAFLTYHAVFLLSITYVFPLTHFSKQQRHRIGSFLTRLFLQKYGFASTTQRDIVFSSLQSGGLCFHDIFLEQGIVHIIKLVQMFCTPGQLNLLLRICLRWWQALCGASYPLLKFPSRPCLHQEGHWLQSTRSFLSKVHGSIHTTFSYHHHPLCTHDQSIMDAFSDSGLFGATLLCHLNYCRLYLQVQDF